MSKRSNLFESISRRFGAWRMQRFIVIFSNSVIEHLTTESRQQQFAAEVARVGKLTPVVRYLPKRWQAPLVRRATVWALLTGIKGDRKQFYIVARTRPLK